MGTLPEKTLPRNGKRAEDALLWRAVRGYSALYGMVKDRTGRNLRGLGFLLRRLTTDREFEACGYRWMFDHRIGGTYMRLVGGSYNEPETHAFLRHVAEGHPAPLAFIDVGSNIGEMLLTMASFPHVTSVTGFEPHPVCVEVGRANLALNDARNAQIMPLLVGDGSAQPYVIDSFFSPTSGIRNDLPGAATVPTTRLDDVVKVTEDCVLLIDVEGAELDVMRGGQQFISQQHPLIIFEYHEETRKHFALSDVRSLLGAEYHLMRLRVDGFLDEDLYDTWNCVAVHADSAFYQLCQDLIKK